MEPESIVVHCSLTNLEICADYLQKSYKIIKMKLSLFNTTPVLIVTKSDLCLIYSEEEEKSERST